MCELYEAAVVYGAMIEALDNDVVLKIAKADQEKLFDALVDSGADPDEYEMGWANGLLEVWRA